jgi:3-oxoadipate enol-lactonase
MDSLGVGKTDTIHVMRAGPRGGTPIVFLHPVGLDSTWWGAQIADFGRDHDVLAFDMPGHGLTDALEGRPSFDLLSNILETTLVDSQTGPAHLVGVSVGGMIAQNFALRRPDLVRSLALVATLCSFPDAVRTALRQRAEVARTDGMATIAALSNERWFPAAFRERRPDMLDRATRSLLLQNADFHGAMWDMIAGLDLAAELPRITCPTLVIVGAEDVNAPEAAGQLIAGLIPGASLKVMPGIGHFPPFEAPDAFNDLLRSFFARQHPTTAHG